MSKVTDYRIVIYEYLEQDPNNINKYWKEIAKDSVTVFNCEKTFALKTIIENFLDICKKYISVANHRFINKYEINMPIITEDNKLGYASMLYDNKPLVIITTFEISYNSDNPNNRKYRDYSISVFNHKRYITDKNGYVVYTENYEEGNKDYNKLYDTIDNIINNK